MPRKRKNSESFYSNHVGNVEQTASGKFLVRARKRKIPTNEQEVTVETLESGKARLRKLDQLYLKKAAVLAAARENGPCWVRGFGEIQILENE